MKVDETTGMVVWKKQFDRDAGERLLQVCQNPWNRFKTGIELLLRDDVRYEDTGIREKLCEVKKWCDICNAQFHSIGINITECLISSKEAHIGQECDRAGHFPAVIH